MLILRYVLKFMSPRRGMAKGPENTGSGKGNGIEMSLFINCVTS